MPTETAGPLMLLDSAGLWFRAFHSVPEKITGPHGRPVNAIRGFCDMVATLVQEYRPSGLVAALDEDWRPSWRVELVPGYKAHRVGTGGAEDAPETLGPQVEVIREVLRAAGVATAGAPEAEADDVLAHLARAESGRPVVVVTGDRDLLQLAGEDVSVLYLGAGMRKRVLYRPDSVAERVGLPAGTPAQRYADVATLVGDPSDGLPGAPGIGPATAAALVAEYGSLEQVLAAAQDPATAMPARRRAALVDDAEALGAAIRIVRLGDRELALRVDGAADGSLEAGDPDHLAALAAEHGVETSVGRLTQALRESVRMTG